MPAGTDVSRGEEGDGEIAGCERRAPDVLLPAVSPTLAARGKSLREGETEAACIGDACVSWFVLLKARIAVRALLVVLALTGSCAGQQRAGLGSYELVISGGRVIDPESGTDGIRNVGISGGKIQSVRIEPLKGQLTIDAAGLVVAPGFIDLDSYAHLARFSVQDGVTTALDIRRGTANVDQWYSQHERMLINLGVGMGYSLAREEVMGRSGRFDEDTLTYASERQLAEILAKIQTGLDEGAVAVGMGASLRWSPPHWELLETMRVATARKGPRGDHYPRCVVAGD